MNIADFARVAANFNGTNKVWTSGDSNYDNITDIGDFSGLTANFNQSIAGRGQVSVPFGSRSIAELFDDRRLDEILASLTQ